MVTTAMLAVSLTAVSMEDIVKKNVSFISTNLSACTNTEKQRDWSPAGKKVTSSLTSTKSLSMNKEQALSKFLNEVRLCNF